MLVLRDVLEAFPGFAAIAALDGTVVETNTRDHGGRDSVPVWELSQWHDSAELRARVRDAAERAARGELVRFATTIKAAGGASDAVVTVGPVMEGVTPTHVVVFLLEAPRAATDLEALGRADNLYRAVFDFAGDGIFVADRNGRYIEVNARGCELVGYTREELLRLTLWDLSPVETPPVIAKLTKTLRDERWLRRKDGTLLPIELTGVKLPDGTMLGLVRDISLRRRAEAALIEREQELEALADATREALFVHQDGVILATNKAARELYRLSPDGAVGRSLADFVAPESLATVQAHIARASSEAYEAFGRRADGTTFPATVQARTTSFRGRPARLAAIQDLTELRKLQASLAFADRMASVGTLAAGVAHEINNPLTFVTVGLGALARRLEQAPLEGSAKTDLLQIVRDAQEGADRVASIVRDLKVFSRADDESTGAVSLAAVIEYAARMVNSEIKHRAELVIDVGEVPPVVGNETRLGQVFINLLINAAQAIPQGKADLNSITVSARVAGDRVVVSVADTGEGIDPSLVDRIFEPFVTTKSHGTGLGLAICHGIVTRLGGTIEVERAPERGTIFRVSLPIAAATADRLTSGPAIARTKTPVRRGRVLMIDDEPLLLTATRRVVEGEYDVAVAESAKQALARLEQGERFDAILCDLMMPEITGMELYEQVRARWPEVATRFVFLTGGVFSRDAATFLETCGRPWLDKPFQIGDLLAAIRGVGLRP